MAKNGSRMVMTMRGIEEMVENRTNNECDGSMRLEFAPDEQRRVLLEIVAV